MRRSVGLGLTLLALCALVLPSVAAAKPKQKPPKAGGAFEVGAAKTLANPPEGERLCLGGYGACPNGGGRTMTGIADDLYARALAVGRERGREALILVHTTNVGFFASYKTDGLGIYHLRQEVSERTGVAADQVIVQSDHSHSGPDTIGIWGGVPTSYLRRMQDAAVNAAVRAWRKREPANMFVGTADGPGVTSSYENPPNVGTDDEFRLLWAKAKDNGARIATLSNYSPHATVQKSDNKLASGDWPEWAAQMAEERFGGTGIGGVGTLGREDFGAQGNDNAAREADARARISRMIDEAGANGRRLSSRDGLAVRSTFITEPLGQPILALNLLPEGTVDGGGYDVSIDRSVKPPFLTGPTLGTFAGAARIGDVFIGISPGEAFPQIQRYLRDEGGITGASVYFHLGAANDFLGYMVRPIEDDPQVFTEGAGYLIGCPEEEVFSRTAIPYDEACTDHWTLMASPTIGSHVACTIQASGEAIGFGADVRDPACPLLTRTDGVNAPAEGDPR